MKLDRKRAGILRINDEYLWAHIFGVTGTLFWFLMKEIRVFLFCQMSGIFFTLSSKILDPTNSTSQTILIYSNVGGVVDPNTSK